MKKLVIYIHGKGGSAAEAAHYVPLFPDDTVVGLNYRAETPWEAVCEFSRRFDALSAGYDRVCLIANSIGAFFALCSLSDQKIEKAFFISPVVNMESLISDMMRRAAVTESELREKKELSTSFGETLSWDYLQWVRGHPISWDIPTEILFGSNDALQTFDTVNHFAEAHHASVTVMENGEHRFHTEDQMKFLDAWIRQKKEQTVSYKN